VCSPKQGRAKGARLLNIALLQKMKDLNIPVILVLTGGRIEDSKGWSVPKCGEHTRQGYDIYVLKFSIGA
jgi:hypothetical protein